MPAKKTATKKAPKQDIDISEKEKSDGSPESKRKAIELAIKELRQNLAMKPS
jgi:hypothetical protein